MLDKHKNKGEYRPYLRNINVQWDRIDLSDVQEMRFEPSEFDEYQLRSGDLLVCEGGEPGRCAIWSHMDKVMMFQKAIHRVRPYNGIVPRYLLFHFWADARNGRLEKFFTGATIKHFTGKALADYPIALPPSAEQQRIVTKVDQLMRLCDALEAGLAQAETARRRATAAALQVV
jgi:type I restriction enzyme S subunit